MFQGISVDRNSIPIMRSGGQNFVYTHSLLTSQKSSQNGHLLLGQSTLSCSGDGWTHLVLILPYYSIYIYIITCPYQNLCVQIWYLPPTIPQTMIKKSQRGHLSDTLFIKTARFQGNPHPYRGCTIKGLSKPFKNHSTTTSWVPVRNGRSQTHEEATQIFIFTSRETILPLGWSFWCKLGWFCNLKVGSCPRTLEYTTTLLSWSCWGPQHRPLYLPKPNSGLDAKFNV